MSDVDDKRARRRQFGMELERCLGDRSRGWLGAEVARDLGKRSPITASAVGQWISGETEPGEPERVFAIERIVGVEPGTLSRYLGYVPVDASPVRASSVPEAIEADENLEPDFKTLALENYDACLRLSIAARGDSGRNNSARRRARETR